MSVSALPSRSDFDACVGSTFRIHASEERKETVKLAEVTTLRTVESREHFSVIFCGGPEQHLPQKIYRMEHETLGTMELFLVPLGPGDQGMLYQAVFA